MDLAGANAIVTGAAVGTGRAIAERLAADGADLIVADVDERGGEETVARIEHAGGRARFVRADMLAPADVEALIEGADGLRVLVNNAGGGGHVPPHFPPRPRRSGAPRSTSTCARRCSQRNSRSRRCAAPAAARS